MSEAASITVAVRIRPPTPWEADRLPGYDDLCDSAFLGDGHLTTPRKLSTGKTLRHIVKCMDDQVLVFDPPDDDAARAFQQRGYLPPGTKRFRDQRYKFDRVFDESASQQDVFENTTKSLLDGIFDGFNATVFAYGATGCGKTHTISGTERDQGVIYRTMNELFSRIDEQKDDRLVELAVTYLEIYNENIRDLLGDPNVNVPRGGLQLREDKDNRVTVANLTELRPTTAEEVQSIVQAGNARRTQSPTHANETSSRSHAVLQISLTISPRTANTTETKLMATLSIIDLAGSERASATKNMGDRMIEGANINKSLLALGNCINALCESGGRTRHIPYRNSKLTRLLKFSLGGNCKTVMIVCVAPTSQHFEDTSNTLKYANRAKEIKTKVSKNLINVDRHVAQYVEAIQRLNGEVAELKGKLAGRISSENEVDKRRKADARVEAEKAKADMCARTAQSRTVIVDGAVCEGSRDAADIVLRAIRPRLTALDAEAAKGPLSADLVVEREYLASLAAPHQSFLTSDSSRQNLQRSENTRSMLEATLRAVSERRADRLDEVSVENVRTLASLQRAETEAARVAAREQALKAALVQQSEVMAQMIGVLGQYTALLRRSPAVEDEGVDAIRTRLDSAAQSSHQTVLSTLSRGAPLPTPSTLASFPLSASVLAPPSAPQPAQLKPRRRSSAVHDVGHSSPARRVHGGRSPRKSVVFRQSISQPAGLNLRASQSLSKKAVEKKSLRWRDEAGEGDIDDAGLGRTVQENTSTARATGSTSETEWEDEKTDDSFGTAKDISVPAPPRRVRSSRLDPSYLKTKSRLSILGEEMENDENSLGVAVPQKFSRGIPPLGERGNLPSPEELSDDSLTFQPKKSVLGPPVSPAPRPRVTPMSGGKARRISNIGPIRVQKPRRRTSMIPQPAEDAPLKPALGAAKRVQIPSGDPDMRRSPVKKPGRRISGMGARPSITGSMSMRGPFKPPTFKPNLSASLTANPFDMNASMEFSSLRGKAAWK